MEKQNNIEEICMWYPAAQSQRKKEMEHGFLKDRTRGFEDRGCYDCDGQNTECLNYYTSNAENVNIQHTKPYGLPTKRLPPVMANLVDPLKDGVNKDKNADCKHNTSEKKNGI